MEYSYYGRMDSIKPKEAFFYMLLDEYMIEKINKKTDELQVNFKDFFVQLKKEYLNDINNLKKNNKELTSKIKDIEDKLCIK